MTRISKHCGPHALFVQPQHRQDNVIHLTDIIRQKHYAFLVQEHALHIKICRSEMLILRLLAPRKVHIIIGPRILTGLESPRCPRVDQ